jgi:hypothetical protein
VRGAGVQHRLIRDGAKRPHRFRSASSFTKARERQPLSADRKGGALLAIAGTGYGLIGLLVIILIILMIVYFARRA